MAKKKETQIFLHVLIHRSDYDGCWAALALEMDIRGYGETPTEALNELGELVEMQISFAKFKGDPLLIWKPADPVWVERFTEARVNQLRESLLDIHPKEEPEYKASGMAMPPAHVIAKLSNFQLTNA